MFFICSWCGGNSSMLMMIMMMMIDDDDDDDNDDDDIQYLTLVEGICYLLTLDTWIPEYCLQLENVTCLSISLMTS